ncbi:MAG: hypothetical protein ACLQMT_08430 [Candidatus Acidiferrales bacterium]
MKFKNRWLSRATIVTGVLGLSLSLLGGAAVVRSGNADNGSKMGLVDDWTHHHVIFSDPGTMTEAMAQGRYDEWYRIASDPRYIMQTMKRNRPWSGHGGILNTEAAGPHRDWAFSLGNGTVAENMFPAKFGFNINATPSCALDYAVYGLNVAGATGGQANLVALNNLYSGSGTPFCTGHTTPTVYWAYNASFAGGAVTTSPVLSLDGSKIIFVESAGTTGPYLHILVWDSADGGTVTASKVPTHVLTVGQGVSSCPSGTPQPSCLVSILLNSTTETITNSSPYYDYGSDTVYVGDDDGNLYKVTPVLGSGTPVVKTVSVAAGTKLTGPTLDGSSGYVFVGSTNGALYAIRASSFSSVAGTLQVGDATCTGAGKNNKLTDAPMLDSTNGWVYEYVTANTTPFTAVEQASTAGPFTTRSAVEVGEGESGCGNANSFPTHLPAFDNNYVSGAITSGHIWVCGRETTGGLTRPELWEIPTSGAKGSISGVTAVANSTQIDEVAHAQCSPFTAIYNGSTNYLFFGEGLSGNFGRLYGYTISGTTATGISGSPLTYPTATGGTSAIVIDNVSSDAQASSLYFTTLATSTTVCGATAAYCAIKLTQSALQ